MLLPTPSFFFFLLFTLCFSVLYAFVCFFFFSLNKNLIEQKKRTLSNSCSWCSVGLYGRHPLGLLDIAKETWEGEHTPHQSVIEHIVQMQDRIAVIMPIVKEHLAHAHEA